MNRPRFLVAFAPRNDTGGFRRARGFTMIELMISLVLLALMSAVLFGSLNLAGRSTDAGTAKAEATSGMRLAGDYLRTQLAAQHPQRMRKIADFPLLFGGAVDEMRYTAPLPGRVGLGGMWYYRLKLATVPGRDKPSLILERMIPDVGALDKPEFVDADRSVLADDIKELKFAYYGINTGASVDEAPTWRDQWDDTQLLPQLIRVDVTPEKGLAWPTLVIAPREAPEAGCRNWDAPRKRCAAV
jgi:general secretion pathway protein J